MDLVNCQRLSGFWDLSTRGHEFDNGILPHSDAKFNLVKLSSGNDYENTLLRMSLLGFVILSFFLDVLEIRILMVLILEVISKSLDLDH